MKFLLPAAKATLAKANALICALILCLLPLLGKSQEHTNREFRGVWVATVGNLDWPVKGASAESQKAALRALFDKVNAANLNAVFFQVRTECDAFYSSSLEPWSRFLTGTQGADPGFDPLAFAIAEAHSRGLELHAWINPFRVNYSTSSTVTYASNHVSKTKPEWLLGFSTGKKILNPGIPAVRTYIAAVVKEITDKYDVDGIHFDDYFYPYPEGTFTGITNEDAATFAQYAGTYTDVKEWRRNNVNETIRLVREAIQSSRPEVRFGVSPFGIWKPGTPSGITGMDAYNVLYADPLNWLQNQYVDYLSPQLYWAIGGNQDYRKLLTWWSDKAHAASRHLYAGHAIYKTTFSEQEIPNQISITRENRPAYALGDVLYRAANLTANTNNLFTQLQGNYYKTPAAAPAMSWKNAPKPAAPQTLSITVNEATGAYELTWQRDAANTNTFKRYVLYTSDAPINSLADLAEGTVKAILVSESFTLPAAEMPQQPSYWAVTELGVANVESDLSNVVSVGSVTSVAELAQNGVLKVYPNPANRVLNVDLSLSKSALVRIDLYSMDGRIRTRLLQKRYDAGLQTITLNRDRYRPGVYALIISIDKDRVVKRVILK